MRKLELSITARVAVGFGVALLLIVAEALVFHGRYSRIDRLEARRSQVIEPAYDLARDLRTDILRRALALRSYALTGDERFRLDEEAVGRSWSHAFAALQALNDPTDADTIREIDEANRTYQGAHDAFIKVIPTPALADSVDNGERQLDTLRQAILAKLDTLIEAETTRREKLLRSVSETRDEAREALLALSLLLVGAVGVAGALTARSVRRPTIKLLTATRALSHGDFGPAVSLAQTPDRRHNDELRELAEAFGRTAAALQRRERRTVAQGFLSASLAAQSDLEPLASEALTQITAYVPAQLGAVFLSEGGVEGFRRVGGYAAHGTPTRVMPGEGLPGQAIASMRRLVVRDIPSDTTWRLQLGAEPLPPRTIVATPLLVERRAIGVIVLASVHDLDDDMLSFVDEAASQLAVSLANALANRRMADLAQLLKTRNEALQEQAENIEAQNEELQAQTEEIQVQNDELRTREELLQAQNAKLATQAIELAEADHEKDQFLSIASHELRTPVTTLKLYACQLSRRAERRPEWEELIPALRAMDRQASRLADLVTRMLDGSRVTMRKLEIRRGETDLAALVRQSVAQAQTRTTTHRILLECADSSLIGDWDAGYLEQVIVNLLENAIRYSPSGGDIHVTLQRREAEVVVSVSDSGIGIPEEAQAKLFHPYFRHAGAKAVSAEGLGLGLYVSHEIVRAHGGAFAVRSSPGDGSTFTVTLPGRPVANPSTAVEASADSAREAST